jgi:hypothetical protein
MKEKENVTDCLCIPCRVDLLRRFLWFILRRCQYRDAIASNGKMTDEW